MEKVQTKTDHLVADMKQMKDAMENSMRDLIKRNISMEQLIRELIKKPETTLEAEEDESSQVNQ